MIHANHPQNESIHQIKNTVNGIWEKNIGLLHFFLTVTRYRYSIGIHRICKPNCVEIRIQIDQCKIQLPAGGSFYFDIQFSSVKGNRLCDDCFLITLSIFQRFHCFNKLVAYILWMTGHKMNHVFTWYST